jgi:hypothetical protein
MNILKMTDSEVYHLGMEVLGAKLGTTGASRFLNLIEPRTGNYTLERYEWLDNSPDIDTLVQQIQQTSKELEAEQKRISKLKANISENGKPQPTRVRELPDEDLYRLGLEFLVDKLGPGGMSHFLRVCEPGRGVYAVDQHKNPELIEQAHEKKQKQAS